MTSRRASSPSGVANTFPASTHSRSSASSGWAGTSSPEEKAATKAPRTRRPTTIAIDVEVTKCRPKETSSGAERVDSRLESSERYAAIRSRWFLLLDCSCGDSRDGRRRGEARRELRVNVHCAGDGVSNNNNRCKAGFDDDDGRWQLAHGAVGGSQRVRLAWLSASDLHSRPVNLHSPLPKVSDPRLRQHTQTHIYLKATLSHSHDMSSFKALRASREARHTMLNHGIGGINAGTSGENETTVKEGKTANTSQDVSVARDDSVPSPDAHLYPELGGTALEVRTSKSSGRGLYAARDIAAGKPSVRPALTTGTTLLRLPPRTAVLSTPHIASHCSGCFQKKNVQRCAACKALHYCSAGCQKADWAAHKDECAALSRFRAMWAEVYPAKARAGGDFSWVPNEAGRALGRMCWARRAGRREQGRDPDWVSFTGRSIG